MVLWFVGTANIVICAEIVDRCHTRHHLVYSVMKVHPTQDARITHIPAHGKEVCGVSVVRDKPFTILRSPQIFTIIKAKESVER